MLGGAWGYMTDGKGVQHLGAREYWPLIGRFLQQDPTGDGMNWYAYVGNDPTVFVDPSGLFTIPGLGGNPWLVFDDSSWDQLGMSAGATASGVITGLTGGQLYHHLKELALSRFLSRQVRGEYHLSGFGYYAFSAMMILASDLLAEEHDEELVTPEEIELE